MHFVACGVAFTCCVLYDSLRCRPRSHNGLLNALASYIESNIYSPLDEIVGVHEVFREAFLCGWMHAFQLPLPRYQR